jgi:GMP synthase-like glutamine amidotransferase
MRAMRIACVQHEETTPPAAVRAWAQASGHDFRVVRSELGEALPTTADSDLVVVLGGSMNVTDIPVLPWLGDVRGWLGDVVRAGDLPLLGICLGAQLLADVLGGTAGPIDEPERGWMRFQLSPAGRSHPLTAALPAEFEAFQSHGQGFTLPPGAEDLIDCDGWPGQGFAWGPRCLAVQFHPEFDEQVIRTIAGKPTTWRGPGVRSAESMLERLHERIEAQNQVLHAMLDALAATAARAEGAAPHTTLT